MICFPVYSLHQQHAAIKCEAQSSEPVHKNTITEINRHTDRQIDRRTGRQADTGRNRHTHRQAHT